MASWDLSIAVVQRLCTFEKAYIVTGLSLQNWWSYIVGLSIHTLGKILWQTLFAKIWSIRKTCAPKHFPKSIFEEKNVINLTSNK
jgi:hypothetical protein